MDPLVVSVRSQLSKIIEELDAVKAKASEVSDAFEDQGKAVSDSLRDQTKKTATFLSNVAGLGRRVADQLKSDFKALASITALTESFRLSQQFRGSLTETVKLSDSIRKLGTTLGLAKEQFASFHSLMVRGLGEIGLSSNAAANTLEGLSETPVRGERNILSYAKQAGMLASIGREEGQEGVIAKGMADVLKARGVDPNNASEMQSLAETLRRVYVKTGAKPSETLSTMANVFSSMPREQRSRFGNEGFASVAEAALMGGPAVAAFLKDYLGKTPIERLPIDAQIGANLITDKGIDLDRMEKAFEALHRIGFDVRASAKTLGFTSDEAAEGFVRLYEMFQTIRQNAKTPVGGNLSSQYLESRGLGESFRANLNRTKSAFSSVLSPITQKATDILSNSAQSDLGAGAIVAGAGILAAVLAGVGLRGVTGRGKGVRGLAGSLAKGGVAEAVTGKEVQPVYVVNAAEIGGGGGGIFGKFGGMPLAALLGQAGLLTVGVGAVAYGSKSMADREAANFKKVHEKIKPEQQTAVDLERMKKGDASSVGRYANPNAFNLPQQTNQRIIIELNKRDVKASTQPTRGASFGVRP